MTAGAASAITLVVTREYPQGMKSTWWIMKASCQHGVTEHQLVASTETTLRSCIEALTSVHRVQAARRLGSHRQVCRCRLGTVTIERPEAGHA